MKTGPSHRKWHDHLFGFFEHPTLPTGHFYTKSGGRHGFTFHHRLNKPCGSGRYEELLIYESLWTTQWRKNPTVYRLYKRTIDQGQVVSETFYKEVTRCVKPYIRRYERDGYSSIDRFDVVG